MILGGKDQRFFAESILGKMIKEGIYVKEKIRNGSVRVYLAYKRALSNIKGSPTMEYIIVIAVGAAFATLLYNVFSGEDNSIFKTIKDKVEKTIQNSLNGSGGSGSGAGQSQQTPP